MATTNYLGLYLPIGTLKAVATGGTTTTFLCTNPEGADIPVGMRFRIFDSSDAHLETTTFTVTGKSVAGVTTVTFEPAAAVAVANTNRIYQPEKPDVTSAISDQMDRLDPVLGNFECTSLTRPTAPTVFTGMMIYETDTQRLLWYNGTDWQIITDGKAPLGIIGTSYPNTTFLGPAASATVGPERVATVSLVAGRSYALRWMARTVYTAGSGSMPIQMSIRKAAGGTVLVGSPSVDSSGVSFAVPYVSGAGVEHSGIYHFTETVTGTYTFGLTFTRTADAVPGTLTFSTNTGWYLEDVGIV